MTGIFPAIYTGQVVHRRLRPVVHHLAYKVACVLVDVDQLERLPVLLRYNRWGLFSLRDQDQGDAKNTRPLSAHAWSSMRAHGAPGDVQRIMMLCYPRILGYSFNPITVFFGLDENGHVRFVLYEVHNTFGGRHIYPAGPFAPGEDIYAAAAKTFRVSPFNGVEGHYGLRVTPPEEQVAVGVSLTTSEGPVLKAYFSGVRSSLSNATLLKVFLGLPFMTFKVMAGIHWEALKLWLKGLKLQSP
jgi:uncharacterized protein